MTSSAAETPSAEALALAVRLDQIERRTPETRIELGLDRVREVLARLDLDLARRRVVTVAGTNGKGSTVAFIESGLRAAGRRTLAYTSPHLLDVRERFRIDGALVDAGALLAALDAVERARDTVHLTYFEQLTLAAFVLAERERVDDLVLEVGLGGRLDAVNVLDPDLAVITSIGLDHKEWLGSTRAAIALEKCGVARAGRPVVVAESRPPAGMLDFLERRGAVARVWGTHFDARWAGETLSVRVGERRLRGLRVGLPGRHQRSNAAAAVLVLRHLEVPEDAVRRGLADARAAGRFERIADAPATFVDVAHNPAAARALRATLAARPARKRAVFAALADKDIEAIVRAVAGEIHRWYPAALEGPRAVPAPVLAQRLRDAGVSGRLDALESVAAALERARADSRGDDEVIVFGSFLTAAAACEAIRTG